MAIVCLYIRPRVLEQEWHCREAYEEATFTFILLVEDVLKSYRWNEFLLVATSIYSVLCGLNARIDAGFNSQCGHLYNPKSKITYESSYIPSLQPYKQTLNEAINIEVL